MYYEHCGTTLTDLDGFCPQCGGVANSVQTEPEESATRASEAFQMEQEADQALFEQLSEQPENLQPQMDSPEAKSLLIMAVVGLILAGSLYLSIPGVVLSMIALYKSVTLSGEYSDSTVKIGKILSFIGLIVGAVMTLVGVAILAGLSSIAVR